MTYQSAPSLSRVRLVAPLARSGSGSEAFLALASDGNQYWVKASDNPQGARTLVAEVISYGIARMIGAPVPANVLVEVPTGFPWSYADGRVMRGGLGHGSRNISDVVEADDWATYSKRDDNRRRQAFIFALWDLCMGADPQWLHEVTNDYSIWSFDHGFWLAGEADWDLASLEKIGTSPWRYDLDPGVASAAALEEAAGRVSELRLESIRAVVEEVPLGWNTTSEELSAVASIVFARTEGVAERLRSAAKHSRNPEEVSA